MQLSSYFNRHKSVTAFFSLLLLSVLNIAVASPLPRNVVSEKSLTTRAVEGSTITFDEYVAYLKEYYTKTDQYIEYSGFSEPQVRAFQAKNPGYYYYADFFDADNPNLGRIIVRMMLRRLEELYQQLLPIRLQSLVQQHGGRKGKHPSTQLLKLQ